MSTYQVIARKYRPRSFDGVVGQEAIAQTLKNAIESDRVAHAYMFCGPRGVGKTSMARILARALNCLERPGPAVDPCGECDLCVRASAGEDLDVLEIDAASNRKVDDARNLIANVSFHPTRARFKVYVVDEVHMLTTEAFNALLKTLEEPPPHVKFIFATTDPQKVPATILSRCQRFDFRPVAPLAIAGALARIAASEGIETEEAALIAIAHASVGGMRDAQSLLEQLSTLGGGAVTLEDLHTLLGTVPATRMRRLFEAVSTGDVGATLARTAEVLDAGTDPGELLRQCMRHARDLMLVRVQGARAADVALDAEDRRELAQQAERFSEATLIYAVSLLAEALKNVRLLGEGRLFAETALARLAGHGEMRFLDRVVRDLARLEQRLDSGDAGPALPSAGEPGNPPRGAPGGGSRRPHDGGGGSSPRRHSGPGAMGPGPQGPASRQVPGGNVAAPAAPPSAEVRDDAPPPAVPPSAEVRDEPPPPSAPGQDAASAATGASALRARWSEVLEHTRGQSRLRTALAGARVETLEGSTVTLSLPAGSGFARAALQQRDLGDALSAALADVAGRSVVVRTVEREPEPQEEPDTPRRSASDMLQQRLTAAEVEAIRQAPITKLIETELGGRIVHMQREN